MNRDADQSDPADPLVIALAALDEAIELAEDAILYVPDYFKKKNRYDESIEDIKKQRARVR